MQAELLVLRIVHVLGGVFWVGSLMFTAFFLFPTLAGIGPQIGGQIMGGLQKRRLMLVLPVNAIIVILSGARLMQITSNGFSPDYFRSPMGSMFAGAGAVAIVAFVFGILVTRPAMMRVAKLSQAAASDGASRERIAAEVQAMQRRATMSSNVVLALVLLSAVGMAIARYL